MYRLSSNRMSKNQIRKKIEIHLDYIFGLVFYSLTYSVGGETICSEPDSHSTDLLPNVQTQITNSKQIPSFQRKCTDDSSGVKMFFKIPILNHVRILHGKSFLVEASETSTATLNKCVVHTLCSS